MENWWPRNGSIPSRNKKRRSNVCDRRTNTHTDRQFVAMTLRWKNAMTSLTSLGLHNVTCGNGTDTAFHNGTQSRSTERNLVSSKVWLLKYLDKLLVNNFSLVSCLVVGVGLVAERLSVRRLSSPLQPTVKHVAYLLYVQPNSTSYPQRTEMCIAFWVWATLWRPSVKALPQLRLKVKS